MAPWIDRAPERRGTSRVDSPFIGRWAAISAVAIFGISCQVIHGFDQYDTNPEPQSNGAGGATSSSGTGGGPPPNPCGGGATGVCLATVTAPWMPMFFSVESTAVDMGPASCPDESVPSRFYELSTIPADCSDCTCGDPVITCSAPFEGWEDSTCTGAIFNLNAGDGTCIVTGAAVNGIKPMPATSTATCDPSPAVLTPGELWDGEHSLCAAAELPAGTCEGENVCVERTGLPLCIQAPGDVAACPAGWESADRYQYYLDADDNRGCNNCTCAAPPENLCTGGTYQIFDDAACMDTFVTVNEGDPCVPAVDSLGVTYIAPTPVNPQCTVGGGQPNGNVTGTVAVTLCCR